MPKRRSSLFGVYNAPYLTRRYCSTQVLKKHNALIFFYSTRILLLPAPILLSHNQNFNIFLYSNYLILFFYKPVLIFCSVIAFRNNDIISRDQVAHINCLIILMIILFHDQFAGHIDDGNFFIVFI